MKAVQIDEYGGPEVLRYRENVQEPEVAANKLLIDIHAATVNPVDWKIMSGGRQKQMPLTMPFVLGVDLSGVVREVGEGITEFAPGDPVWAVVNQDQPGGYQEVNAVDAGVVSLKPKNVSHLEAAALALTGLTAMVAIDDTAGLKPDEKILVQGGAGGVGSFAVQAAKAMGAEVFATCSERNIDYVRSLGVDHVIDYTKGDFRDSFQISKAVAKHMKEFGEGSIVLTTSASVLFGVTGGNGQGGPAYVSSKGAVLALMRSLARALGPEGIRVNAVSPGITDTPMVAGYSEKQKASMKQRFPLGRFAEPYEIAEGAIFLISDKASFMTGENMHINGGSNFGG